MIIHIWKSILSLLYLTVLSPSFSLSSLPPFFYALFSSSRIRGSVFFPFIIFSFYFVRVFALPRTDCFEPRCQRASFTVFRANARVDDPASSPPLREVIFLEFPRRRWIAGARDMEKRWLPSIIKCAMANFVMCIHTCDRVVRKFRCGSALQLICLTIGNDFFVSSIEISVIWSIFLLI